MNCPICGKEMVSLRPLDAAADSPLTRDPFPGYPNSMLCQDCGIAVFPCKIVKE